MIQSKKYLGQSELTLWNQLRTGDEEAFSLLFERFYSHLVNYGITLLPDSETVKDCVQEVFADIWSYRYNLKEAISVKAYLFSSVRKRIARLQEREHIFSKSKDVDSLDFIFEFAVEDHLIADEVMATKVNHLNRVINNLPSRQKEALYLRFHQALSVEQVAQVLDVNYQSTKNLLHRAILQLRKEFPVSLLIALVSIASKF